MFFEKKFINHTSKGFSLAECLIVVAIIGVLAALTMPMMYDGLPKKEEELHKKVTYSLEQTIANMYDDDQMYPKSSDDLVQGFQNTNQVFIGGKAYGCDAGDGTCATKRKTKFCELFASKFKKIVPHDGSGRNTDAALCSDSYDNHDGWGSASGPTFVSSDGVYWYVPITDFNDAGNEGVAIIYVDVNGAAAPNTEDVDRFKYYVKYNGTVSESDPTKSHASTRQFNIQINQTTKNKNNEVVAYNTGGVAKLTDCGEDGSSCSGSSSTGTMFENLQRGHVYRLEACPKYSTGANICGSATPPANAEALYTSNWSEDKKNVKIVNQDVTVSLVFREIPTSEVTLKVEGCPEIATNCGTIRFKKNCKYKKTEVPGQGMFKYNSTYDIYEYAGINDTDADYIYECDATSISPNSSKSGTQTFVWDGLKSGNYGIEIIPTNSTLVDGNKYTLPNMKGTTYVQSVRLGTVDLTFTAPFIKVEEEEE